MTDETTEQLATVSSLSMIDESGAPFVQLTFEHSDGVVLLSIDQAIAHSSHVMEAACVAELEAAMYRWLVSDKEGSGDPAGAAKIIAAFRAFRSDPNQAIGGTDGRPVHEPPADA